MQRREFRRSDRKIQRPCFGANLAQRRARMLNRQAAGSEALVRAQIGRRGNHLYPRDVHVELVGGDLR